MKLPNGVYSAVDKRRVRVFKADRGMTRFWNDNRGKGDLRFYCGYYWYEEIQGRQASPEHGPFPTSSAAYRDAFIVMGLKQQVPEKQTQQITGSNVVTLPRKATQSPQGKTVDRHDRALQRRLRRFGVG